jgi:DNA-binding MarR family transcriptional regulator
MDLESQRDLELLLALEEDSRTTQRSLAGRLGIALGLTNLYLKRLARKGYIKCVTIPPNRLVYLVTPRGLARKARLTYEFMQYSLDLYRDARHQLREAFERRFSNGDRRIAIFGTGDAAELAYLSIKELNLELVAVFDGDSGRTFLGLPVQPIERCNPDEFDALIVATLEPPQPWVDRLLKLGVPEQKLVTLRR